MRTFQHVGSVLLRGKQTPTDMIALASYTDHLGLEESSPTGEDWNELFTCFGTVDSCRVPSSPSTAACAPGMGNVPLGLNPAAYTNDRWFTMTVSATHHVRTYRCTTRYNVDDTKKFPLPGGDVPGVTRWRWLANDEGHWTRCASLGCCETLQQ